MHLTNLCLRGVSKEKLWNSILLSPQTLSTWWKMHVHSKGWIETEPRVSSTPSFSRPRAISFYITPLHFWKIIIDLSLQLSSYDHHYFKPLYAQNIHFISSIIASRKWLASQLYPFAHFLVFPIIFRLPGREVIMCRKLAESWKPIKFYSWCFKWHTLFEKRDRHS